MPFPFCAHWRALLFYPFCENKHKKGFFTVMKKSIIRSISIILSLVFVFALASCSANGSGGELWENASYTEDVTVGDGAKTVTFTVETAEKTITITLKTDKNTLGDAMYELGLINDAVFFDVLNGIEASWAKDQAYWAFYEGETLMPHGVNDENIDGGESYRFVYTK